MSGGRDHVTQTEIASARTVQVLLCITGAGILVISTKSDLPNCAIVLIKFYLFIYLTNTLQQIYNDVEY